MSIQETRDFFMSQMPHNLCETGKEFFRTVESKEEVLKFLRVYPHWSLTNKLVSVKNRDHLGTDLCNEMGVYVDQVFLDGILVFIDSPAFIFSCEFGSLVLEEDCKFAYLGDSNIKRLVIMSEVPDLIIQPKCFIDEIHIVGRVKRLRLYDSLANKMTFDKDGKVDRLIFGRFSRITDYDRSKIGTIVGD